MKKLFYYTDICMLLSKEEKGFEKIRRCFDIFEERKDSIYIIWGLYSDMKEQLLLLNPKVARDFEALLKEFSERGLGEVVETDDLKGELMKCDAYYGDANEILFYAQKDHIPAMVADVNL